MMLYIGLGFLVDWLLMQVFTLTDIKAALVTAIIFLIIGLLFEGRPLYERFNK